jgi:hypothetical protein
MPDKGFAGKRFKIYLKKPVPPWWRFAYLIPDIFHQHSGLADDFIRVLEGSEEFDKFVMEHVEAYLEDGKLPPESIVGPILNIAEDIMAGRQPTIRAGDYISLQNHIRVR